MKAWSILSLALTALFGFTCSVAAQSPASGFPVSVSEGTLTIPTYEPSSRELEPPLFPNSTVKGLYPFPTYAALAQGDSPKPKTYRTILLENEYLKLTYIPEFGGRFFSLYDKARKREVFYRNDVIKPTMFNPRQSWPVSGIELTGPFDVHTLTLHGEPFWSNTILRHPDGSVSLVLGESDPVYHMKVNLSATLYPGIAAMQISVFCYNANDSQMPQMFWTNAGFPSTDKTRFIYPMTRTVGHTSGMVSDWPLYNGVDLSWDRNNQHMLGVFGIDSYDNFAGSYQFDHDYGVFRYADRRIVQGMKLWTFGYGPGAEEQQAYTDDAGPYVEVQSGRYVWDGHYEWVAPHKVETWSEWWIPVGGIGGLTTITRDVALNLTVEPDAAGENSEVKLALSPSRAMPGARLVVSAKCGELLKASLDLTPGTPISKTISSIKANADGLKELTVRITDASGQEVMHYIRPDEDPGRKEYSPLAKGLENPEKSPEQMSAEELVEAAEFKLKEMDPGAIQDLVDRALKLDPGYSQAHLLLGVYHYNAGDYKAAVDELSKATERDPYLGEGWYYLAISQLALGDKENAERNLYFVGPDSAYFGEREYQLGKLALLANKLQDANEHFNRAVLANGYDLNARALYALTLRIQGKQTDALAQLTSLLQLDPTNRIAYAERFFLSGDAVAKSELLRLMGEQSQEALDVAIFYGGVQRWREAAAILRLVEQTNRDPWSRSPLFNYTLAYFLERSGESAATVAEYRKKAQAAAGNVDRFPYRRESEAPLAEAANADSHDAVARFNLGCLLFYLGRQDEAIANWRSAVALDPNDFSARRELGLAYAAQGKTDEATQQLEKAIQLRPDHVDTFNDLSSIYASAGRFDDQIALIKKALLRSPANDDLTMALLNADLIKGRYDDADRIVRTHNFAPRHRSTILRDEYRNLRYGMGAVAFNRGDYAQALEIYQSALKPPVSLHLDDFQFQAAPRAYYYIGRTLEALGRKDEAASAYRQSTTGIDLLSGDRDSWNSENFFAVLSLERLGETDKAKDLLPRFEGFARTEMDYASPSPRGKARYLLALIEQNAGNGEMARKYMNDSLQALPDFLEPRYELRGDTIDPVGTRTNADKAAQ